MFIAYMSTFRDIMSIKKFDPPEIDVCNPQLKSGAVSKHHVYTLRGRDRFGDFEVLRRYSEFDLFREILVQRFPGIYVPPLPKKKIVWL